MSFDISAMEQYVAQNAKDIAAKVVTSAKTAKLLLDNGAVQFGKGTIAVNTMSQTVTFTDGSTCGRVEDTDIVLSQRKISYVPLKNQKSFCFRELYGYILAEAISKGQNAESLDASIYGAFMDNRAQIIAWEYEKLLWKGDSALTGSSNLKWFDGYVKLISANSGSVLTAAGSDVIAKLQSVAAQIPVTLKEQEDFRVFIGKDTHDALVLALYNKNMFNPGSDAVIPGTTVKLEVIPGLNSTAKAVASRISNLKAIMDEAGEETKAVFKYDELNDKAMVDFFFGGGVQTVFPDQAYIAAI